MNFLIGFATPDAAAQLRNKGLSAAFIAGVQTDKEAIERLMFHGLLSMSETLRVKKRLEGKIENAISDTLQFKKS